MKTLSFFYSISYSYLAMKLSREHAHREITRENRIALVTAIIHLLLRLSARASQAEGQVDQQHILEANDC
jgi:hypothetical protein